MMIPLNNYERGVKQLTPKYVCNLLTGDTEKKSYLGFKKKLLKDLNCILHAYF